MGMIARNPTDATEPPKVKRREMSVMDETDYHLFLEYAKSTPYHALFYTLLFTGLRRSEILALQWKNTDLLLCQISITRSIHQMRYGNHKGQIIYKEPKSAKSRRLVDLTPSNTIILREHYEAQKNQREALNLAPITDEDLVFCNYDGSPYLPDGVTHAWRHLADKVGMDKIRLHDSRHSHASYLLKRNIHPAIVAQRLGHSSVQITMDVYSHILPGLQKAAATDFDSIITQKV
jgi:integrase